MLLENEFFTLEPSAECAIPGYLILRVRCCETGLAGLSQEKAGALGQMLSQAAKAIEKAAGAERIYVLSFCELDRRLHFHLFPRTGWLLREYRNANGRAGGPVDGAMLFAWARGKFLQAGDLPAGVEGPDKVFAAVRTFLDRTA